MTANCTPFTEQSQPVLSGVTENLAASFCHLIRAAAPEPGARRVLLCKPCCAPGAHWPRRAAPMAGAGSGCRAPARTSSSSAGQDTTPDKP